MYTLAIVTAVVLQVITYSAAQDMETINGSIFCNNDFSFYINGRLIAEDPLLRHNAYNVTFQVEKGQDITFAIDARDLADNETGLEFGNRCVGSGGLRAIFSNGVVTNNQWVCTTYHYGPDNWPQCFSATDVRNFSLQLPPVCREDTTPPLSGCTARVTARPQGWTLPDFDDSHWEYAMEFDDATVGFGLPPPGCEDPNVYISSDQDPNGVNLTCQNNLNWGASKYIWRPDLYLDNHLLCRYTLKLSDSAGGISISLTVILLAVVIAFAGF